MKTCEDGLQNISVSKGGGEAANVHAATDVGSVRPQRINEEGGFLFCDIDLPHFCRFFLFYWNWLFLNFPPYFHQS